ncbi:formate/nitrite transporter family protein [Sphingomonas sp.]|jgi:formate/nitrite transporter FocA (FNT family)|uniref:formate/nitrite transporter family protein n=1 Tax=Sphingomonas sp. TaxID=28214 RepID=UPI0035C7CA20
MGKDVETEAVEDLKAAEPREVHRAVREEGERELDRPTASLFWSALAAGLAINASLLAEGALHLALPESPAKTLLVSFGYPIGFVIVILGRMQFFTESTITAMLPLVARPTRAGLRRTMRLWGIVLSANLIGTAVATLALSYAGLIDIALREAMVEVSQRILTHDALATFLTAIPAGFLIASIAWMLPNGREQAFFVIFAVTWTVGAAGLSHSVVGSAEAFLLMWHGDVSVGRTLATLILPAVAGNLLGGAGLFSVLAHGQVSGEVPAAGGEDW